MASIGTSEVASPEVADTPVVAIVSVTAAGDTQMLALSSRYTSAQECCQRRAHVNREEAYRVEVRLHFSVLSHSC